MGLFYCILVYMLDLHLVHPILNLSVPNAGILIKEQLVRLMRFSLNMVDYTMSFLLLKNAKNAKFEKSASQADKHNIDYSTFD